VGAAHPHINLSAIKAYLVPHLPDDQQRLLVDSLDEMEAEVESLASLARHKLVKLAELKQSLLHQAFTGGLTVKAADKQFEAMA
jgi:type I restriction enzyme S subunit